MFFLGISAHLMIYLLVPALLMVFFYFRGIPGKPEAGDLLPVVVIYEHQISPVSEETYIYGEKKVQKPRLRKKAVPFPLLSLSPAECSYYPPFYPALFFRILTLRAPPCIPC